MCHFPARDFIANGEEGGSAQNGTFSLENFDGWVFPPPKFESCQPLSETALLDNNDKNGMKWRHMALFRGNFSVDGPLTLKIIETHRIILRDCRKNFRGGRLSATCAKTTKQMTETLASLTSAYGTYTS